jgi:hypothetical protein
MLPKQKTKQILFFSRFFESEYLIQFEDFSVFIMMRVHLDKKTDFLTKLI